jgi:ribosomal protein S27AE
VTPQRVYRAACPGCGAPVEFRSAQSTHAVCSFCHSTVVRDDGTLSRIGKMAELFDDHSPLQLLATGRWQARSFTLVGRLQYRGETGTWAEWIALFDDDGSAVLAEDNGAYVLAWPADAQRELPPASQLRVGASTAIAGKTFSIASSDQTTLIAAQGELPKLPPLGQPFAMVELRSADGEVLSIDYGSTPPVLSRGRSVLLDELQLSGLRDDNTKQEKARQFSCPNCGAPVQVQLAESKSITCGSCHSVIDLTSGIGSQLRHALQDEPVAPAIPLGSSGQLQGAQWQVVGFQHRMGHEPGDDEQFGWDEYLLYNQQRGFIFLVDSEEGWSVVKPTTGAPKYTDGGSTASYLGTSYQLKYSYQAQTSYVAGQ